MSDLSYIKDIVNKIISKYNTRDPIILMDELNISYKTAPFFGGTKGYLVKMNKKLGIIINSLLDEQTQKMVIAHELGHAILHSDEEMIFIKEFTLFNSGRYEVEANKFAAELLIDDQAIDPVMFENKSIEQIAMFLEVDKRLVSLKLQNIDNAL